MQTKKQLLAAVAAAGGVALLAACGSGANNNNAAKLPTIQVPAATLAAAASASPVATAAMAATAASFVPGTPASNPVQRVMGTVQTVSGTTVTLSQGGTLVLSPQTVISVTKAGSISDVKSGDTVAITAKQQPDGTLLASLIRVFPTAPGGSSFFGQHPIDGGNLMTNATVDKVQSNGFSATFPPNGTAQVSLAPDGQITLLVAGSATDIKPGQMIAASVLNGVAQTITTQ